MFPLRVQIRYYLYLILNMVYHLPVFGKRESSPVRMTQFSNFAIRVLMYTALNDAGPTPVPEIARAYGASYDHMKKAAALLCRLGYLKSVRGRVGGVSLARLPQEIGIGEVIRATENDVVLVECFDSSTNTCPLEPACILKRALHEAVDAFFASLDRYTLADLICHPEQLSPLLALTSHGAGIEGRVRCG